MYSEVLMQISSQSFNRYMVECEYVDGNTNKGGVAGFNRYMVECE